MGGYPKEQRFINDPIHGAMGFSRLELSIIESQAFRRLRNIKQLGLADLVYPSAGYSRFVHSLGVCHLAGRFMRQLEATEDEYILTRVAALTHDIGHYPFSHATEEAFKEWYKKGLVLESNRIEFDGPADSYMNHEKASEQVLALDPEISRILSDSGIDPFDVARRFRREDPHKLGTNVISSDFDVDRTDFLLRTAHAAGLPYGQVDLDYLVSVLQPENKGGIPMMSIPLKAVRAADHFLIGRFFDYQTVAFHKTVCAFEKLLEEAILALLDSRILTSSEKEISEMIKSEEWHVFDDGFLLDAFRRQLATGDVSTRVRRALEAVLFRKPPKLVAEVQFLAGDKDKLAVDFETKITRVANIAHSDSAICDDFLFWLNPGMKLTKVTVVGEEGSQADEDQLIHVRVPGSDPIPLIVLPQSLLSICARNRWYCARFYSLDRDHFRCRQIQDVVGDLLKGEFAGSMITLYG